MRLEKEARVLDLSMAGRNIISSDALCRDRGASGNPPTGEACVAPFEGTAAGRILIDVPLGEPGRVRRASTSMA